MTMSVVSETEAFSLLATQVVESIESYLNQYQDVNIEYDLRSQ